MHSSLTIARGIIKVKMTIIVAAIEKIKIKTNGLVNTLMIILMKSKF